MTTNHVRRKRPNFQRVIQADSAALAEEIVVLDALVNASGMHGDHFDIHYHDGKWLAIAKDYGLHVAEVMIRTEKVYSNKFIVTCDSIAINPLEGRLVDVEPDAELLKQMPLQGLKVYVLMESQFVPQEIEFYEHRLTQYGATVELVSYLWGCDRLAFHSHYDQGLIPKIRHAVVHTDFAEIDFDSPQSGCRYCAN